MESLYSVKLGKLIQEFRLEVLRGGACSSPDFSTTLTPSGSR